MRNICRPCAPGVGPVAHPGARVCPAADVHTHIGAPRVPDGCGDVGIALLLAQVQPVFIMNGVATAEVHLDEVEAQILEEHVTVLLVVLVEPHAFACLVATMITATGVIATVAVDAGLLSLFVDIVHNGLQSVGESGRVYLQLSCLSIPSAKVSIVNIDMVITNIIQSL